MFMTPVMIRLREWRGRRGLSQKELADAAETQQETVSNLETGKTQRIEFDLLDRLAKALGCKPSDLIGED